MNLIRNLGLLKIESSLAILFSLITSILLILGSLVVKSSDTLEQNQEMTGLQYVGLSAAAWHQEMEVYFTLKALSSETEVGLGFMEPLRIQNGSKTLIPLKFKDYSKKYEIKSRPYLSHSGILADLGKLMLGVFGFFGISFGSGLLFLYFLNVLLNGFFVFLLLVFGFKYLLRPLARSVYTIGVFSPWVVLDSTSITLSPFIRFGGIFSILLFWFISKKSSNLSRLFPFFVGGLVFSTINGYEFFFFQVPVLLLFISAIYPQIKPKELIFYWARGVILAWGLSLLLWFVTLYSNLNNFWDSVENMIFTFFKHSIFRSDSPPISAVASGDSSLFILSGLTKLLTEMSIILPYPFPESLASRLRLNLDLLENSVFLTSFTTILVIGCLIKIIRIDKPIFWFAFFSWCVAAILTNSYVYNHPHHMPPVGLFFLLGLIILSPQTRGSYVRSNN